MPAAMARNQQCFNAPTRLHAQRTHSVTSGRIAHSPAAHHGSTSVAPSPGNIAAQYNSSQSGNSSTAAYGGVDRTPNHQHQRSYLSPAASSSSRTDGTSSKHSYAYMEADIDIDAIATVPPVDRDVKAHSRLRGVIRESSLSTSSYAVPRESAGSSDAAGSSNVCDELLGFTNIGNTCFMNSTLQCLLRTGRLRRFLLVSDLDKAVPRPAPLTVTLQDICRRMFSSSGGKVGSTMLPGSSTHPLHASSFATARSIAPSNFKNCLASYRRAFAGSEQHDAHEFLRFTLDGMHDECNAVTKSPPYVELKDIENESIRDTAARWLENHTKRNASVVQDAFCGQFASETICQECKHRSVSCETFLDLSVPIPRSGFAASNAVARDNSSKFSVSRALSFHGANSSSGHVTIQNALEEFFAPAELSGTDAYHCPKCKKPTRARRVSHIFQAPDVLVVHLKRFRHSRFMATKINDLVRFPVDEALDLAPFMHPQAAVDNNVSEGAAHRGTTSYQLQGIVHHMGSVHSGHYVAHCRCSPKQGGPSRWFEFNDSSVSPVSASCPESALVTPSAYVLLFERIAQHGSKL